MESLGKLPGNPVNPVKKNSGKMCCVLVGSIAALLQSGAEQLRPKEMQKKNSRRTKKKSRVRSSLVTLPSTVYLK